MARSDGARAVRPWQLERLLEAPRFEVIPAPGIEEKASVLGQGATVTVTCSPRHGIDRTLEVSERLVTLGHHVVPHLAARMVRDRDHLRRIVERLSAAGIGEAFVVGGDASPPAGSFRDAGDLLDALSTLEHSLTTVGIGGYPEGHPLIGDALLLEALRRKQQHVDHIVTQICFDAATLVHWIGSIRAAGIRLPVLVGLPGVVERRKLAEISLQTGVGSSLRYLARHGRQIATLARSRRYDPTPLAQAIAAHLDDPGLGIQGVHLFTFNQVEATRDWVLRAVLRAA
ncbi:MAG TPA: methylenetetrahydrofolate reductase [Thermoleophilia bacterium]|nr:methylenetetrahydrofolate reductase [Thermoleophilia bacterium]